MKTYSYYQSPKRSAIPEELHNNDTIVFNLGLHNIYGVTVDGRTCADLAKMLELSEYDIFLKAYHWYYGFWSQNVDAAFKEYLLSGCETVPCYVRQFARHWHPATLLA